MLRTALLIFTLLYNLSLVQGNSSSPDTLHVVPYNPAFSVTATPKEIPPPVTINKCPDPTRTYPFCASHPLGAKQIRIIHDCQNGSVRAVPLRLSIPGLQAQIDVPMSGVIQTISVYYISNIIEDGDMSVISNILSGDDPADTPIVIFKGGGDRFQVHTIDSSLTSSILGVKVRADGNILFIDLPEAVDLSPLMGLITIPKPTVSGTPPSMASAHAANFIHERAYVPVSSSIGGAGSGFVQTEPVFFSQAGEVRSAGGVRKISSKDLSHKMTKTLSHNKKTLDIHLKFQAKSCGGVASPLMLFFDQRRPAFKGFQNKSHLSPSKGTYWPERGAPGYFLALDKNKDGKIAERGELFGDQSKKFKNGFEALRVHDKNKDGKIDSKDPIFSQLLLWKDSNGNAISEKGELTSVKSRLTSISLKYRKNEIVPFGRRAEAREHSDFRYKKGKKTLKGKVIDIWFRSGVR